MGREGRKGGELALVELEFLAFCLREFCKNTKRAQEVGVSSARLAL